MRLLRCVWASPLLLAALLFAQRNFTPGLKLFLVVDDPVIALEHVQILDGTGTAPQQDRTILVDHGVIRAIGDSSIAIPAGARRMNLENRTVLPGLVGMHEHLFYPSGEGVPIYNEQAFSFPRLYLASGVTTARTAGSMEFQTDLNLKKLIDEGRMPGPRFLLTAPYLDGPPALVPQLGELKDADDARRTVEFWAAKGATSFKAYMNLDRARLGAAIDAAHKLGLKVTGHLCAVTFREAAELGIDNLEHGLMVDTEFDKNKRPDVCPNQNDTIQAISQLNINGPEVDRTIRELVEHRVAITSTLAVFEALTDVRPPLEQRLLDALSPQAATTYLASRARPGTMAAIYLAAMKKEMEFERKFVQAGGLLMAGCDPTGNGGALAGFGDQRNLELLVEAGFTPAEAVRIATRNGAQFLGEAEHLGSVKVGHQADLVVVEGNAAADISRIRRTEIVFKNGQGYDPQKLIQSVAGAVGLH